MNAGELEERRKEIFRKVTLLCAFLDYLPVEEQAITRLQVLGLLAKNGDAASAER